MDLLPEFEKMRPYNDSEVPMAINRIINEKQFQTILSFLYPAKSSDEIIKLFSKISTVTEFQTVFSHYTVREIVRRTSNGLSFSGIDKLEKDQAYLFISNHRDIVLDSAIMQVLLFENNHKTSQITFGSNLMSGDLVVDLGKLNKMFTFYRGGSKLEMYKNAFLHSEYIRDVITRQKESIWIAQRDGRTKDGDDKTQAGLIKMLIMGKSNPLEAIQELNIVPVTISYEYEPCDVQKVQELYTSKSKTYKKHPSEDMESILRGLTDFKGHIHLSFGTPVNNIFLRDKWQTTSIEALAKSIIDEIDYQIYTNYRAWPVNYVAHDLFKATDKYAKVEYSVQQKLDFIEYIQKKIAGMQGNKDELAKMFIRMYAMPVINKL